MTVFQNGSSSPHETQSPADTEPKEKTEASSSPRTACQKLYSIVLYTPKRCRYDPANPPKFSTALNLLFAFAGCFTVANLYYSHPILHILAEEFGVSNERVSLIPTLAQAGYASGLLFLCPLGDVLPRRLYVLALVLFTATVWLGLCLTNSFAIFCTLTFLTSVTTVTPQLMLPLVGDLCPPHRRASALSIVASGLSLGLLFARLLSGVVTNYTSWRNIYWLAFALQYLILALLYLFMPDYPSTNPSSSTAEGQRPLTYPAILTSILTIFLHHPLLVQAGLVAFCTSITFTSFWTTLTFLLSQPQYPYSYSTLVIGLFALIGISSMLLTPFYSRYITDRFIPLFTVLTGILCALVGTIIGTYTGTRTIAGPVIQALLLDFGVQTAQVANRSAIYAILPKARNRVNTAYMICAFFGQLTGTAVGNAAFARKGWVGSGSISVGFLGVAVVLCVVRGPREQGWWGRGGGWRIRKRGDRDNEVVVAVAVEEKGNEEEEEGEDQRERRVGKTKTETEKGG